MSSNITAAAVLSESHPLHKKFVKWLAGKPATKRKAAAFLSVYPQYKTIKVAA